MEVAIRYYTKSKKGNTVKLANAVSSALELDALDVTNDLNERVEKLFLINAMYAANIDKEVVRFLERNKDMIGEVINMNTSASGASTYKALNKATNKYGINLSDKEFHCAASWVFINKGLPTEEDLNKAKEFAKSLL